MWPGLSWWLSGKELTCQMQETQVRSLGQEDPLEKGMATISSILARRIPWTKKPGGLACSSLLGHKESRHNLEIVEQQQKTVW